jgi:hypothetical protein
MEASLEARLKETEDEKKNDLVLEDEEEKNKRQEAFMADPKNLVPPEILNNIAVLRMEQAA